MSRRGSFNYLDETTKDEINADNLRQDMAFFSKDLNKSQVKVNNQDQQQEHEDNQHMKSQLKYNNYLTEQDDISLTTNVQMILKTSPQIGIKENQDIVKSIRNRENQISSIIQYKDQMINEQFDVNFSKESFFSSQKEETFSRTEPEAEIFNSNERLSYQEKQEKLMEEISSEISEDVQKDQKHTSKSKQLDKKNRDKNEESKEKRKQH